MTSRTGQNGYWNRYWRQRMSRRRALQTGAVTGAGAAGLALVGCGDDDDGGNGGDNGDDPVATATLRPTSTPSSNPTSAEDAVNMDGTLNLRQGNIYASIHPWKGLDSGLLWGFTIFDHLWYTPLDTLEPELFLATSLEQPEGLDITCTIGDAVFHDKPPVGDRKIVSTDVKASMEQSAIDPGISQQEWWFVVFDGVDAPDDETVIIRQTQVDAWGLTSSNAGSPINGSIIPEEIALDDPDFMQQDLIGSGRLQFVSHENGTNFRLERNPNWRNPGHPWIANQNYHLIQDQAQAIAAFSAKEIDVLTLANARERDNLIGEHGDSISIDQDLSRAVWTLQGRGDGQWANPLVSQAISMSVDRDQLIELMFFGEGAKSGIVPPAFGNVALAESELQDTWFKYDPAEAATMLAATDFDTSQEYEMKFISTSEPSAQFGQIIQEQLSQNLGIQVNLVGEDFGTWLAVSLYGGNYNGFMIYPTLAYDEPSAYILNFPETIGGRPNWAGFVDPEMTALFLEQKTITDEEERFEAVKNVQRKAWEKGAPYIPTVCQVSNTAYWNYVKNRITGRGSYGLFNDELWVDEANK